VEIALIRIAALATALLLAPPALAQENTPTEDEIPCGYLCVDGVPLDTTGDMPADTELVKHIFLGTFSEMCSWAIGGGPSMYEPETYELTYRPSWEDPSEPERALHIYRIFCGAGAYNEQHVYYSWTASDGVQLLTFARPRFTAHFVDDNPDGALESIETNGMAATLRLVNSTFDPATGTVIEMSCWRGLCDASSRGQWVLSDGEFKLVTFDIDPTYDGEITLFRIADFAQPTTVDLSAPVPDIAPQMLDPDNEEE
jgi:hypothetical protein